MRHDTARAGRRARGDTGRRKTWRVSIATALSLIFGGLLAVAVLAVGFVTLRASELNTIELLGETTELYLDTLTGLTAEHLADGRFQAEHVARLVREGALDLDDPAALEATMAGSLAAGDQVRGIAVVRADGMATRVGYLDGALGSFVSDWSDRPTIRSLLSDARGGTLGDGYFVVWSEDLQAPHVSASAPLIGPDGTFLGAVSTVVAIAEISKFLTTLAPEDARAFVLLGREKVLAHADLPGVLGELSPARPLPHYATLGDRVLAAIWDEPVVGAQIERILAGRNAQGHIVEIGETGYVFLLRDLGTVGGEALTAGVYAPLDAHNRPLERLVGSAAVAVLILLVSVVLSVLLGRALARPVRRLERAAEAAGRLDLEAMPELKTSRLRELDAAQAAFAGMGEALGWFATYVPRALVFRLMSLGPAAARSVEREVTCLFTDIAGFTQLAERGGPEETAALLNDHFALLAACVEAEGGTVDKYIGDSLMAFWGAPDDQPDHAARACRAALAMAAAVEADNARRAEAGLAPVRLRIGLHSGPAVAGNIGAPTRMNYTLVGDTVNVAQRLEQLGKEHAGSPPGPGEEVTILASGDTVAAAGRAAGPLDCTTEDLGSLRLRGRATLIPVCRLTGKLPA